MSTDRELLELAAKASGVVLVYSSVEGMNPRIEGSFEAWNPLTDDGDALRLLVRLNMQVGSRADGDINGISWADGPGDNYGSQSHNGDMYAATRRAIVRAAAEIGKAMP